MIAAVCLNPCIDRMLGIDGFSYGGMNRIKKQRDDGSGKGVNVAIAVRELGMESVCIGILPEEGAEPVLARLSSAGCESDFVRVPGRVRVNTKLRNSVDGVVTEINESGAQTAPETLNKALDLVARWGSRCDAMVMTGSLPPGCPADFYAQLMRRSGARCVLDAEGEKLTLGLKANPVLIKPNRYELEIALGRALPEPQDVLAGIRKLAGDGMAAVSMGGDGAVFSYGGDGWYAPRVPIEALSTVGAGDCMVAGMLYALERGFAPEEVFRHGVAGGTAGCVTPGTELLRRQDFFELLKRVEIQRL